MIVDTSAVIAILRDEPEAEQFSRALATAPLSRMSAANFLEAAIVIDSGRNPISSQRLDDLVSAASLEIEPVTEQHARVARRAYRDFGKGSGHPAGLNFGDCFAYALAKCTNEPLLFKGLDFSKTDLQSAG